MKSAIALAATTALIHAAALEQSGYVIDLCPSEEPVTPITLPSARQILNLSKAVGFVDTQSSGVGSGVSCECDYGVGGDYIEANADKIETLNKIAKLNRINKMYKAQELLADGIASWEAQRAVGVEPQIIADAFYQGPAMSESQFRQMETLRALGEVERRNYMLNALASARAQEIYYPGSTQAIAARQMIAPAAYNLPVGIVERESFLPGSA